MKTVAVIQARMNSRRFPGKVLADLCGKPVLQHVVDRVRQAKLVDLVVVAIPVTDAEVYFPVSTYMPTGVDENDVLGRVVKTVAYWDPNLVVRVCGDNPLVSPELIDQLVTAAQETAAAYVGFEFPPGQPAISRPNGYVAEVVTLAALLKADRFLAAHCPLREHVTRAIYENPWCFNLLWLPLPGPFRWMPPASIDTPEDLECVEWMIREDEWVTREEVRRWQTF